jgi:hypothetical protein
MKVKHTLLHSALAYQNLWMMKSTMPFHWQSPHHLRVYHNLTSYQMMTMMKFMKYSGTYLCMCIRMNSQINVFVSANQPPRPILHETLEIEFKLGMDIIFKDGTGKSEHVVYKGLTASGPKHVIRCIDGSQSNIDQSHLSFINQIEFENIPQSLLDYCQEVGIGITQEHPQQLACPRALTPQQKELIS